MRTLANSAALAALLTVAHASTTRADLLIVNGGFEAGLASWTVANQAGGDGTFALQTGTTSPVNGDPVPAPPGGIQAAMSDGAGPGSHVLYQDFVVPTFAITAADFRADLFVGNRSDAFRVPAAAGLDFSTPALNQQARVDLMRSTADPFSVAAADVLLNLYQTQVGDPLVSGYTTVIVDLTAILNANRGATLRLRFAEVDNVAPFQFGVDNVRVEAVPEPASLALCAVAAAVGLARLARRRNLPRLPVAGADRLRRDHGPS